MNPILESERLLFRELLPSDAEAMFEMDSDPEVHLYLGNNPVKSIDEVSDVIENIQWQYETFGLARMAVILKETNEFIGWAGLKRERNLKERGIFYDLGYRFLKRHWGKGYATESAKAFVDYGFTVLNLEKINAYADAANVASCKALEKAGLKNMESFELDGVEEIWYEILNPNIYAEKS
ncbi:GNAT family N-acetyltransferase [Flavobacterium alkalisoli]|uniref:GNAT family N-acetyltransferase n=1 Tax=Flavobacterium alkalisoli TaxID=2602769 RepID=A0A5B9FW61_9FLAO|nr:GNAT family N-acetyltransferase [Flavobacterium alkalisoli]QEE51433.1 GNAT family N-acetyltransferase [Flavobacterium alkalisoli]